MVSPIPIDWREFHERERATPAVVDSRRRMRLALYGFLALLGIVFGRVVQLEVSQGPAFRGEAARPLVRTRELPAPRGRILARNGTVLACDKQVMALAVYYRYLEEPPDGQWLRRTARARLSKADRKNPERAAEEERRVQWERADLARRLARLCGLSDDEWRRRARQIQDRVERIAASVNRRKEEADRGAAASPAEPAPDAALPSLWDRLCAAVEETLEASIDPSLPERIVVAEELDYHAIAEDLPLDVAAEVEANPARYPGVKVVQRHRRVYPAAALAAHVLGYLGAPGEDDAQTASAGDATAEPDRVGRAGLECRYEELLRGRPGRAVERSDHSGRVLSVRREREPMPGRDLVLTLDPDLQRTAESLLADALRRRAMGLVQSAPAGGAVVVMDARHGAILAAASAPAFDPGAFARGDEAAVAALLSGPGHPFVDRTVAMAIPPGSVFKVVTATALLENGLDADEPFYCQGYLHQPDRQRCAIYTRRGHGHGEVALADALAQSCNVYFFHHAGRLGPRPLVDWASRFGLGRPTGVDLPGEAAGAVPSPAAPPAAQGQRWRPGDTESLAIGQGALAATPVQMACLMAAVANGGYLVTPHLGRALGLPEAADGTCRVGRAERAPPESAENRWWGSLRSTHPTSVDPRCESSFPGGEAAEGNELSVRPPRPIPGLQPAALTRIREGLKRVVCDPQGTAYGSVWLDSVEIAGKTGTAQTGLEGQEHAWFAGYVPADEPRIVLVVALEHAGDAAESAGPVAKRLVLRLQQLGYLGRQ